MEEEKIREKAEKEIKINKLQKIIEKEVDKYILEARRLLQRIAEKIFEMAEEIKIK